MVWGVCRRLLNHHDAEDAFQATFLVLVRKAASIYPRAKVGNWLYGVAHQTALKARATKAKRNVRERPVTDMPEPAVTDQNLWSDLQPLLDQEVSRLPEKYRTVIVLCELEGKTVREAARHLGCPEGTVASRLARARTMLAKRLTQRGLAVSGGTLALVLSQKVALASVPAWVLSGTIQAVTLAVAGPAAATAILAGTVAALTEGVLKTMLLNKLLKVMTVLLVIAGLSAAAGLIYQTQATEPPTEQPVSERPPETQTKEARQKNLAQDDMNRLQGTWRLVTSELDGVRLGEGRPEIKVSFLVFKGASVTMSGKLIHSPDIKQEAEDATAVGTFTLDTRKNPKVIGFTWQTNPWLSKEYLTQQGIYALHGDSLQLCLYFPGADTQRLLPTTFSAKAGSKRCLSTFRRVPPAAPGGAKQDSQRGQTDSQAGLSKPVAIRKRGQSEQQQEKTKAPAPEAEEKDKLQGTWQMVAYETDGLGVGEGRPELKDNRLIIGQESFTLFSTPESAQAASGTNKAVATFTLDASQTPKVMVLTWKECPWNGKQDFVQRAIYAVQGDRLKLCLSRKDDDVEAPTAFSANVGSARLLWTFKRLPSSGKGGEKKRSPLGPT
jgi:RNA polymerase sigma factor (sigma-70 family)